jgi:TolB-like protein
MRRLFAELKRRHVFRVAAAYLATSWLLLEVGSILVPALHLPAWTLTLLVVLLGLGFFLALALSWAFQITPEGLELDTATIAPALPGSPAGSPRSSDQIAVTKRLNLLLAMALALTVGFIALDKLWLSRRADTVPSAQGAIAALPAPAIPGPSVAVLPFTSLSASADDTLFADGLAEEILNQLSQIDGLKVAGRTSSFSFRNRESGLAPIAAQLGVGAILEGTVRRSGQHLRVTARLIGVADGFNLWSQDFDRQLDDVLLMQNEIAGAVAAALKVELLGSGVQPAMRSTADQIQYYEALGLSGQGTPQSLEAARVRLEALIARVPDYIEAYPALGVTLMRLNWAGSIAPAESAARIVALGEAAMRIAPMNLDARGAAVLGMINLAVQRSSRRGFEELLALTAELARAAPNSARLQLQASVVAHHLSKLDLADEYSARAVALEPLDPLTLNQRAGIRGAVGDRDGALALRERVLAVAPSSTLDHSQFIDLLAGEGQFVAALRALQRCYANAGASCAVDAMRLYRLLRDEAQVQRVLASASGPAGEQLAREAQFNRARRDGGYRAIVDLLGAAGMQDGARATDFNRQRIHAALESNEPNAALELLRESRPGMFEDADAPLLHNQAVFAVAAGIAERQLDNESAAQRWFERALDAARLGRPDAYPSTRLVPELLALAWLGRVDEALPVLDTAIAGGWSRERELRESPADTPEPLSAPLLADARIVARLDQVRARNEQALAAIVASGMPLPPVLEADTAGKAPSP